MTKTQDAPRVTPQAGLESAWTGWTIFAAVMLAVVGGMNLIQGLVALFQDDYFVVRSGDDLLLATFTTWGWIMVIWGAIQVTAGLGLNSGKGWARWLAIAVACVSILIQTLFLAAYPLWAAMIIALDVIVIYALTAHWGEARAGL
jgi:hypothetical protein